MKRRVCRLVNQPRGTQRYGVVRREDEDALTKAYRPACQSVRPLRLSAYHSIAAASWLANRQGSGNGATPGIRCRKGLEVPNKQKPGERLRLNNRSCEWLRSTHANHVWSYDLLSARTHNGRSVRLLNRIDESTRECLLIHTERRRSSSRESAALADYA